MEPWTISTSEFSSKLVFQAAIICGLMSTSTTRTCIGSSFRSSRGQFHEIFQALLLRPIDHELVIGKLRRAPLLVAHAVTAIIPGRRCRQAIGDLAVFLD